MARRVSYPRNSNSADPAYSMAVKILRRDLAKLEQEEGRAWFTTTELLHLLHTEVFDNVRNEDGLDYNLPSHIRKPNESLFNKATEILHWCDQRHILKREVADGVESYVWSLGLRQPPTMEEGLAAARNEKRIEVDQQETAMVLGNYFKTKAPIFPPSSLPDLTDKKFNDDSDLEDDEPLEMTTDNRVKYEPEKKASGLDLEVINSLGRRVDKLEDIVDENTKDIGSVEDEIIDLKKQIKELEKTRKVEFTITTNNKKTVIKGNVHEKFPEILFHVEMQDPILLVGPSGSGKTEVSKHVAAHLKREFGMISFSGGTVEQKIVGRSNINITKGVSVYQETRFVELYTKGGVFLADEVDGADSNVLLCLNGPLSNKWLVVDRTKNPRIPMHEKFSFIAAANTYGTGADRKYAARNQLDHAFLKRFVIIEMDYDKSLELKLCPGKEEWVEKMHKWRENLNRQKLERTIDTRFLLMAYRWMQAGKDEEYVESKLFMGWRPDEVTKVKGGSYN